MKKLTDSCKSCEHVGCPERARPCITCRFLHDDYRTYNHVLRKNKNMGKDIFESEDEAREFFKTIWHITGDFKTQVENQIEEMKKMGAIKKSKLEKAKEDYEYACKNFCLNARVCINYINEIEKEEVRNKEN